MQSSCATIHTLKRTGLSQTMFLKWTLYLALLTLGIQSKTAISVNTRSIEDENGKKPIFPLIVRLNSIYTLINDRLSWLSQFFQPKFELNLNFVL